MSVGKPVGCKMFLRKSIIKQVEKDFFCISGYSAFCVLLRVSA